MWDEGTPNYNANILGIYTFRGNLTNPCIINPEGIEVIVDVKVFKPSNPSNNKTFSASVGGIKATSVMDNTTGQLKLNVIPALLKIAINKAVIGIDGKKNVRIEMPAVDSKSYHVTLPTEALSEAPDQNLAIITDVAQVSLPGNMLAETGLEEAENVAISITNVDKSILPEHLKSAIGTRLIVKLLLSIDGKQTTWNNPNVPVTVSIPYKPTQEELQNNESIVVWYIDGTGNIIPVPNGRYNPETDTVIFSTTHFSDYAVAYNHVEFNDVMADEWYNKPVSFIAARGITQGTGNGKFSPEAMLTRGEFIVMMMRAYGISPDGNLTDNFTDAGNTYYTGYLAAAKRLGISAGVGKNMFAPEKIITRQEMFTLIYNALHAIGQLPKGESDRKLSDFIDAEQVAPYAKEAMMMFVNTGIIVGNNGEIAPLGTTTRAQMEQVLYKLLSQ